MMKILVHGSSLGCNRYLTLERYSLRSLLLPVAMRRKRRLTLILAKEALFDTFLKKVLFFHHFFEKIQYKYQILIQLLQMSSKRGMGIKIIYYFLIRNI